jgi:DNA-binding NarL/FixJ family response regulator
MPLRVVIADDHPMCREAARMALGVANPAAESDFAGSLAEARQLIVDARMLVLDLALPDSRGTLVITELLEDHPNLDILVVTGSEQPQIERKARMAGAKGFVSKAAPISEMIAAMSALIDGNTWFSPASLEEMDGAQNDNFSKQASLTSAQRRVLAAMGDGKLNKQIAFDLGLSEITVKAHVKAILRKLGVLNRTQAILMLHDVYGVGEPAARAEG